MTPTTQGRPAATRPAIARSAAARRALANASLAALIALGGGAVLGSIGCATDGPPPRTTEVDRDTDADLIDDGFTGRDDPDDAANVRGTRDSAMTDRGMTDRATTDRRAGGDRAPRSTRAASGEATAGGRRTTLAYPTGDRGSSVVLLEAVTPAEVRVGQEFNYEITVTNLLEDTDLHDVRVMNLGDAPAAGGTAPAAEEQELVNIGTLPRDTSRTVTVPASVDSVPAGGSVANCLVVTYEPTMCVVVNVINPELQLVKSAPAETVLCREINYTYSVTNSGTGTANNVVVTDELPEGVVARDGSRTVTQNVGSLAAGQTETFEVAVKPQRAGTFASAATARSGGGGGVEGVNVTSQPASTNVTEQQLALTITGPEREYVGQDIQFDVTVSNTGDVPSQPIEVTTGGIANVPAARTPIPSLQPGQERTFPVNINGGNTAGELTITAAVATECDLDQDLEATATVVLQTLSAYQIEVVDTRDPVRVGEQTVYQLRVLNEGSTPNAQINLTGALPQGFEFVSATGPSNITAQGQTLNFAQTTLDPGETAAWDITVRATAAGEDNFEVTLTSPDLANPVTTAEPTNRYVTGRPLGQQTVPAVPADQAPPAAEDQNK